MGKFEFSDDTCSEQSPNTEYLQYPSVPTVLAPTRRRRPEPHRRAQAHTVPYVRRGCARAPACGCAGGGVQVGSRGGVGWYSMTAEETPSSESLPTVPAAAMRWNVNAWSAGATARSPNVADVPRSKCSEGAAPRRGEAQGCRTRRRPALRKTRREPERKSTTVTFSARSSGASCTVNGGTLASLQARTQTCKQTPSTIGGIPT